MIHICTGKVNQHGFQSGYIDALLKISCVRACTAMGRVIALSVSGHKNKHFEWIKNTCSFFLQWKTTHTLHSEKRGFRFLSKYYRTKPHLEFNIYGSTVFQIKYSRHHKRFCKPHSARDKCSTGHFLFHHWCAWPDIMSIYYFAGHPLNTFTMKIYKSGQHRDYSCGRKWCQTTTGLLNSLLGQ